MRKKCRWFSFEYKNLHQINHLFFTCTIIAICKYPLSILCRHFLHFSTPVEYKMRYGNVSSISWSYLCVQYKKIVNNCSPQNNRKKYTNFLCFDTIKWRITMLFIGVLDNGVDVSVEMLYYVKHFSFVFVHKHAPTHNVLY